MRIFHHFVDMLKHQPSHLYNDRVFDNTPATSDHRVRESVKKKILAKLQDVHVFMMAPRSVFGAITTTHINDDSIVIMDETVFSPEKRKMDLDVAPPFKTCWFQMPELGPEKYAGVLDRSYGENLFGIFIHEESPHTYLFAFVLADKENPEMYRLRMGYCNPQNNHELWHCVAMWLQPFSKNADVKTGIQNVNERIKFRDENGENVIIKIKKVVHILPKKAIAQEVKDAEQGRIPIDWSHRWEVRAYWRRLFKKGTQDIDYARIGKNRAGEYVVPGYTFVEESVKGPEDLPVIKKQRLWVPAKDIDKPDVRS